MEKAVLLVLSALAGGAAMAQQAEGTAPRESATKAPGLTYRSAFEDYRPFRDQQLAPWREVNDDVARVGGHLGILKSSQKPQDGKPAPAGGHPHQGMHR